MVRYFFPDPAVHSGAPNDTNGRVFFLFPGRNPRFHLFLTNRTSQMLLSCKLRIRVMKEEIKTNNENILRLQINGGGGFFTFQLNVSIEFPITEF